jgi:hypothetical protein
VGEGGENGAVCCASRGGRSIAKGCSAGVVFEDKEGVAAAKADADDRERVILDFFRGLSDMTIYCTNHQLLTC